MRVGSSSALLCCIHSTKPVFHPHLPTIELEDFKERMGFEPTTLGFGDQYATDRVNMGNTSRVVWQIQNEGTN